VAGFEPGQFLHLLPDLSTMTFILRTKYNQYQAIVEPIAKCSTSRPTIWLQAISQSSFR
jgi:hypothetical protein